MPEISKDMIVLLQYLLPGFLVAWICYGMTSHQKPSQFERVVQALIYALFVHFFVNAERAMALWVGRLRYIGMWTEDSELFASLLSAIVLGIFFSYLLNSDRLHRVLRRFNLSTRSSHPSEWCTAFDTSKTWIVAHLKDERRIYGWPHIWPSDPAKGHLFIIHGSWIMSSSLDESETGQVEGDSENPEIQILVDVADVKWIEFINAPEESNGNQTNTNAADSERRAA